MTVNQMPQTVLVTGGAGYVGSRLVPRLIADGHTVKVLDLYMFKEDVFKDYAEEKRLTEIRADIRDGAAVKRAVQGCDSVIHLACVSNDPSFELNPALGKSINYDAFRPLVQAAKAAGVSRFIYASSSSVYGIKEVANVTEDLTLEPLTDYSKFKALCEMDLAEERSSDFATLVIRPATVCGYASRLRLDLTVNILTNHAVNNGKITVFGGVQKRPNIHIDDMVELYSRVLTLPKSSIDGEIFNVGYENYSVMEIAEHVRDVIGNAVEISVSPTDDLRSYHISSDKIRQSLGFVPQFSITQAVESLVEAFHQGWIRNPFENPDYFNVRKMQNLELH